MYLYLLTNTARQPQKLYVGITSRPVNTRLLEHFNTASKKTTPIARALAQVRTRGIYADGPGASRVLGRTVCHGTGSHCAVQHVRAAWLQPDARR